MSRRSPPRASGQGLWAARLRGREHTKTHDIGFLFYYSAVLGWPVTRGPLLRDLGLACADRLVAMFHPLARVIPVGELIWGDYFLLEALARWQGRGLQA